jgi:predicted dehydrogenase
LPGKLLHNLISHGISKIVEFLRSKDPIVIAHGFTSPLLRSIGETNIIDELRVIIDDKNGATAFYVFSAHIRPQLHEFRIYGPKNSLIMNYSHQTLIKIRGAKYKSYLDQFLPQLIFARQYLANTSRNIVRFAGSRFHMDHGMRFLIASFYKSIRENSPPPIAYREIVLTARIMDEIFSQVPQ